MAVVHEGEGFVGVFLQLRLTLSARVHGVLLILAKWLRTEKRTRKEKKRKKRKTTRYSKMELISFPPSRMLRDRSSSSLHAHAKGNLPQR